MRYLFLIIFLLGCQIANADSYLIYDTSTKEVISLSPIDDAVMREGWTKVILQEDFKDIKLTAHPTDYKYINNQLVKDIDKIGSRENAKLKAQKRRDELQKINKRMQKKAYEELKAEGEIFNEVKDQDFE